MSDIENLDSIKRRIAKLLAIAQDDRANAEEAASAAAMAERIMRKYQLDHAEIITAQLRAGTAEFARRHVGVTLDPDAKAKEASGFAGMLAVAVAGLHDCQAIYTRTERYGKTIELQGMALDAELAEQCYRSLVGQMVAACREYKRTAIDTSRRSMEAYRRGFSMALVKSLNEATAQKNREQQEAVNSDSRALVVAKTRAVANYFGEVKYRTSGRRVRTGYGYEDGFSDGRRVDVTRRGVGSSGGSSLALGA